MKYFCAALLLFAASDLRVASAQDGNSRALLVAKSSPTTRAALSFLGAQAKRIKDKTARRETLAILENPAPTFMTTWSTPDAKARVREQLVTARHIDAGVSVSALFPPLIEASKAPQPFLSAPGGTPDHHHAHPGGLAEHTAFNLHAALDLAANYKRWYGTPLDLDAVIAAPIWHDVMKAWCLQWNADGSMTTQVKLAGTSSHHVFAVAEAMHRSLPPDIVVAIAFAHEPATDAARIQFLEAAAILAAVDPIARGYLALKGGKNVLASRASIEANINHLSDHDYVLADPAGIEVSEALVRLAKVDPVGAKLSESELRWMRHRIRSRLPHIALYQVLRLWGDEGLRAYLQKQKVPLIDPSDR